MRPAAETQLCARCQAALRSALRALPDLLADLEITATRRDQLGEPGGGDGAGLPFNWIASDLYWVAANTTSTWARHLVESRGLPEQAGDPAAFLAENVASVAVDEAAGQCFDEIVWLRRAVARAVDRRAPRLYAGRCDALLLEVEMAGDAMWPVAAECGADLFYRRGQQSLRCRGCDTVHDVAARRLWLLARVPDQVATAAEIAAGLATLERPVPANTIHKWASRGLLARRGRDSAQRTLFLIGDVLALLDTQAARLARRPGSAA